MNAFKAYIFKWFNLITGSTEVEEVQNGDVETISSNPTCSLKRGPEEHIEGILTKRKKIFSPDSVQNVLDPGQSSYLLKSSISDIQKENQQLSFDNLKMNEVLRRRQKSSLIKLPEVYCIDDEEDSSVQNKRSNLFLEKGIDFEKTKILNGKAKFAESDDCIAVSQRNPLTSRSRSSMHSNLCLNRVQSMREQNTFLMLLKDQCVSPRKCIPLTNSTIHNMKQNQSVSSDVFSNRSYSFNNYRSSVTKSKSSNSKVNPTESFFDKAVIDLTGSEDDEDQRQAIEAKVISSPGIRNMRSSCVTEETFALDEDLLSSITKKYETRLKELETRASNCRKDIKDKGEEFAKSISEYLEKRLTLKEHEVKPEDVTQRPSIEIAPVTKDMFEEINRILASKKCPLVQIKDTSVKLQDIRTLENTSWLNDEVINAYMNLIKQRYEKNPSKYPKVHCFNTFLYEQLSKKGYSSVCRWTRKIDIFDFEILIIPIHLGNHWCLVQICFRKKLIAYYDSMGSPNNRCLNTMRQYLEEEYRDKKKKKFDTSDWELVNLPRNEIPQQKNAHDCGVFACTFAEHITRNSSFNFDQDHMRYFRIKMMYEILTSKLLL